MKNHFRLSVSKLVSVTKPHVELFFKFVIVYKTLSTKCEFHKNLLGNNPNLPDGIIGFLSVLSIFRDHLIENIFE